VIKGTRDRSGFRPAGILLAVFTAAAAGGFGSGGRAATLVAAPHATLPLKGRPIEAALRQPLRFDALDSQDVGGGSFVSRGNGYALLLERGGAVVSLSGRPQSSSSLKTPGAAAAVVRMTWPGANRRVRPAGLEAATGVSNYLIGNDPARWRLGVPSFGRVQYRDLYPGIDLAFYGNQERLEYDFVVASGGDPRAIRLRFSGEDAIRIDANGDLVIRAGAAEIVQQAPVVYQEHEGTRQRVAGRYVKTNRHEVGFVVAPYDRTRTLYIDPVLVFSTFLGGSGFDAATAVAVDSAGYAYVTGTTHSFSLPSDDVFVTKISPTGASVWTTLVGTDNTDDRGRGIAVDSAGNVYVTGDTYYPGSGAGFPIVGGFVPTTSPTVSGGAILFKLNSTGDSLLYSTVLRSGSSSVGYGVAVEGTNAYVVGQTVAGQGFPIWPDSGPYSGFTGASGGLYYAFIVKINTSSTGLASLAYATRFGGSDRNLASAVAVNSAGQAYVTGNTTSSDFPTADPAQPVCGTGSICNNRVEDAFVSKFSAAGTALIYSTFAGGSGADFGNAIAIDGSGSAYVSGTTFSLNFPVTPGTLDNACGTGSGCSFSDGFVLKLSPAGSSFGYSTYLGGQSEDAATAIAVDSAGNAFVAGYSGSPDFPVTADATQRNRAGTNTDAFVSMLNPAGSGLVYSSYLGGTGNISGGDRAFGIALDSTGSAWIVGQTDSPDFPVTPSAIQPAHGGGQFDGFAVKIGTRHAVTPFDADGDGKSDIFVFRPSNGTWYTRYSAQGYSTATAGAFQWGLPGDIPISGDFDGDGKIELTIFRPSNGTWYIRYSTLGYSIASAGAFQWGLQGDVPIAADFDGDGKTEITVWRPSNGTWYVRYSSSGFNTGNAGVFQWGLPGDVPLTGDFDGDGKTELTIFRPVNGTWYVRYSSLGYGGGFDAFQWGLAGDLPISADFDGDGKLELTIFRPSNGTWYIRYSSLGYSSGSAGLFQWGLVGDVPIAADFDGDGKTEITVWRPSSGIWYVRYSSFGFNIGNAGAFQWGLPGDVMVK
jgi:hypothetical protein